MTKHIVALSFGKDSVAMSLRLEEINPSIDYQFVCTPTGDELPDMKDHEEKVISMLRGKVIKLNNMSLLELINKKNKLPNFHTRWCTNEIKIQPMIKYIESLGWDSVMYVGLRADEKGRLGIIDSSINVEYPMREWGWDINDVMNYLKIKGIEIPERTDCGMCFFQRLPEWKRLIEKYPERYEEYVQLEKRIGYTLRTPGKDTWPTSLEDLRAEILSGRKMRNTKPRGTKKCRFCSM